MRSLRTSFKPLALVVQNNILVYNTSIAYYEDFRIFGTKPKQNEPSSMAQMAPYKMIDKYFIAVFPTTECVNFSQHIHEIFTKTIADIS